jgi:hypothetical protein
MDSAGKSADTTEGLTVYHSVGGIVVPGSLSGHLGVRWVVLCTYGYSLQYSHGRIILFCMS